MGILGIAEQPQSVASPAILRPLFSAADFKIGRAPSTRNGNGFARLDTSTPSGARAFAMIQNLSDWGVVIPYPSVRPSAASPPSSSPSSFSLPQCRFPLPDSLPDLFTLDRRRRNRPRNRHVRRT